MAEPIFEIGKCVWQEDDVIYFDKETLHQAWLKLFGHELSIKRCLKSIDRGDCSDYLMPNGYIACVSYPGNSSIHEVK